MLKQHTRCQSVEETLRVCLGGASQAGQQVEGTIGHHMVEKLRDTAALGALCKRSATPEAADRSVGSLG